MSALSPEPVRDDCCERCEWESSCEDAASRCAGNAVPGRSCLADCQACEEYSPKAFVRADALQQRKAVSLVQRARDARASKARRSSR